VIEMPEKTASKAKIKYMQGDQKILDQVRDRWEELNRYHCERSQHFKEHYLGMTWQKRKYTLLKKMVGGAMLVELAVDESSGRCAGYAVSTLNAQMTGEVESIYIQPNYRRMGIGRALMQDALAWMDQNGALTKQVEVSVGNEVAWSFYGRFRFKPRKTLLIQVKEKPSGQQ
jgi:ribosomal protein S18 acetylase RimI-like enzyme